MRYELKSTGMLELLNVLNTCQPEQIFNLFMLKQIPMSFVGTCIKPNTWQALWVPHQQTLPMR